MQSVRYTVLATPAAALAWALTVTWRKGCLHDVGLVGLNELKNLADSVFAAYGDVECRIDGVTAACRCTDEILAAVKVLPCRLQFRRVAD